MREQGLELFQECDENNSGYLDKRQFNKLLIATDIKEFSMKDIRDMVMKQIFHYFPNGKITKYDFTVMFKIDPEEEKKKKLERKEKEKEKEKEKQKQKEK